jgi:hypothetical protein
MSTQLQTAPYIVDSPQKTYSLRKLADKTLKAAAAFWFVVVVLGQLVFAFTVASFYGLTAARGNWQQWNKSMGTPLIIPWVTWSSASISPQPSSSC